MTMVERAVYSVTEVATILGVSDETVRRMIIDKQLQGTKVRGQWRVPKQALEKYLGRKL